MWTPKAACMHPTEPENEIEMHDDARTTKSVPSANAGEPCGLFGGTGRFATTMRTGIGTAAKREPWFSITRVVVSMAIWGA